MFFCRLKHLSLLTNSLLEAKKSVRKDKFALTRESHCFGPQALHDEKVTDAHEIKTSAGAASRRQLWVDLT
jgi:hypothetical protein